MQDEALGPIDYDTPTDLVAITAMTVNVRHAYRIAEKFRDQGVKVIMGGPHVSAVPHEARQYCDAVAVGNAETLMDRIIADAEQGKLQPLYHNRLPTELPQRLRISAENRWTTSIMASRGCELNCEFCTMQNVFGKFYLHRKLVYVLDELQHVRTRNVFFVDDNFYGASSASRAYYTQIMETLAIQGTRWVAQCRLPAIKSDKTLDLFTRSGCIGLLIGFESLNPDNRSQVSKQRISRDAYASDIKRIHDHGIGVIGSFIFGFDEDTPDTIRETLDFCIDNKIEMALFTVLTPFPGTPLFRRLSEEGRIISKDWDNYTMLKSVFRPKNFTPQELEESVMEATRKFYSVPSIIRRSQFGMNYDYAFNFLTSNILRQFGI